MPLNKEIRDKVNEYCENDVQPIDKVRGYFSFIEDSALLERISVEYVAARYIYKLGEALGATDTALHAHAKFQVMQYASIYEAVISFLLFKKYENSDSVQRLLYDSEIKKAPAGISEAISIRDAEGNSLFLAFRKTREVALQTIKFDAKVAAAVEVGFLQDELGEEIKEFFRYRNGLHIEAYLKNGISYDIQNAKHSFRRIYPFTMNIKSFIRDGVLSQEFMVKKGEFDLDSQRYLWEADSSTLPMNDTSPDPDIST